MVLLTKPPQSLYDGLYSHLNAGYSDLNCTWALRHNQIIHSLNSCPRVAMTRVNSLWRSSQYCHGLPLLMLAIDKQPSMVMVFSVIHSDPLLSLEDCLFPIFALSGWSLSVETLRNAFTWATVAFCHGQESKQVSYCLSWGIPDASKDIPNCPILNAFQSTCWVCWVELLIGSKSRSHTLSLINKKVI